MIHKALKDIKFHDDGSVTFHCEGPYGGVTFRTNAVEPKQVLAWISGTLIQDAMPNLPRQYREVLITGISPEKWEAMFNETETEGA